MRWAQLPKGHGRAEESDWDGALGESCQGVPNTLTLGLTGTAQGLFLWSVISWPRGLLGPLGNSPEFPDFLIYKVGTVLCTLRVWFPNANERLDLGGIQYALW